MQREIYSRLGAAELLQSWPAYAIFDSGAPLRPRRSGRQPPEQEGQMAAVNTETKKPGTKISERKALNAAGEDQVDYTEAQRAVYQHIESGASIEWDFSPYIAAMINGGIEPALARVTAAFGIEGFITKAGHAVNKATKGANADGNVKAALTAFLANAQEGGWTNREGGQEVNAAAVIAAYAEIMAQHMNVPVEEMLPRVTLGWQGGKKDDGTEVAPWPEAKKQGIRADARVKAVVARHRADKLEAAARAAAGDAAPPPLPGLDDMADLL
jgi:hypothetical protein